MITYPTLQFLFNKVVPSNSFYISSNHSNFQVLPVHTRSLPTIRKHDAFVNGNKKNARKKFVQLLFGTPRINQLRTQQTTKEVVAERNQGASE